jgi:hypothetical protein
MKMNKLLRYGIISVVLLVIGGSSVLYYYVQTLEPRARARVIKALEDRFDADVDLKSLDITLFPKATVVGTGLSIRHKGWSDQHPLIAIRRFSAQTDLISALGPRNEVSMVQLEGLEIHIPPRGRQALKQGMGGKSKGEDSQSGGDTTRFRFNIQTIIADGTLLEIEPKQAGKSPLDFEIRRLTLHSVGPGQPMKFQAQLTNPKPPGLIDSKGEFGPWQRDDPRQSAVSGKYAFNHADLSVFKGIAGILSSSGSYRGVLEEIQVDGTTDTPDFAIKRGGAPVHLITKFHAIVDGTSGDTLLKPVDALLLNTEFICNGGVVHRPGEKGKTVSLDIETKHGRVEDILTLVAKQDKPLLTGNINFKTKFELPPGNQDVMDKLQLDGNFGLLSATFASSKVQQGIGTLSRRAQGISKKEEPESPKTVASDFRGRFRLRNGLATFSNLSFVVPGATVNLDGKYNLRSQEIDMHGLFRMEATLSQTQSGVKSWLLKPLDPFFKKDGAGFQIPIKITGTKDHPSFGPEFHRDKTPK